MGLGSGYLERSEGGLVAGVVAEQEQQVGPCTAHALRGEELAEQAALVDAAGVDKELALREGDLHLVRVIGVRGQGKGVRGSGMGATG